jgi:hypothetical protein
MAQFPYIAEYNTAILPTEIIASSNYKGYDYNIKSIMGSYPTAYVKIPSTHFLFGKDYDTIDRVIPVDNSPHGGLTYGQFDDKNNFWIGWDYAHAGDYISGRNFPSKFSKKWTMEEIETECKRLIDFLEQYET